MHEKLKFSFGHIIAFLALMALGYVIFMSVTYYTKGSYLLAGAVTLGIMALMLLLLFRLQLLKGVNSNFEKKIVHERITLVLFTLVCIASFVVFSHFWTVESKKDEVAGKFNQAMVVSQQLFDDYDIYVTNRIESYSLLLTDNQTPVANNNNAKHSNKAKNKVVATSQKADSLTRSLLVKGLELQLRPQQYKDLQYKAEKWINKAQSNFSIWNVFLLGNINNIGASMNNWNEMMGELSTHKMNAEHDTVLTFNHNEVVVQSVQELELIKEICVQTSSPKKKAWLAGLVFLLLYLPWIIQARSPKSMVNICKRKIPGGLKLDKETQDIKPKKRGGTLNDNYQQVKPKTKKGSQLDDNNGNSSQSKRGGISLDI